MPDATTQTIETYHTVEENMTKLNEGFIIKEKLKNNWITLIICDSVNSTGDGTQTEDISPEFVERYERMIKIMNFAW
jgi:hypothetical protein